MTSEIGATLEDPDLEYVCHVTDLGNNEMRRHQSRDGASIAICRVRDEFFGVDDGCTHEKASLTDGYLDEDYVVECPMHGGSFDVRTGEAETFPCTRPIRTHRIVVDGDRVLVAPQEPS